MAAPTPHSPVLLIFAVFSRHDEALQWCRARAESQFGPIHFTSEPFSFTFTEYYEPEMGEGITKQFFAFERLWDPADLAAVKLMTNDWEEEYAEQADHEEPRPLNIDPGYISLGKLVLASAKYYTHRIYLRDGIYAEITLFYRGGGWQHHEWTFPDYQSKPYQQFFTKCRNWLHQQRRSGK